jgi:hypothetical protein
MRKIWSGMLVVLLLSIVAAGCGRQADKRVVITFASAEAGAEQIAIMQKIIGRFEKAHPGIKVKLDWGTTQQKILTQIAGGNPPDVFMWWSGITDLAKRDVLLPLNRFVDREGIDMEQYYKCLVDYYTFDGRLYAFPMQLKTNCIIYNKDIFDKAKVAYPQENWTWDDYCRIAEKLTGDSDNDGIRDRFGANTVLWFEWLLWSGCSVLDNDGKKCILDSDPHVRIENERVVCSVIGETEAVGFCGSGLIDAVALFRRCGLIDESGYIISGEEALERSRAVKGIRLAEEDGASSILFGDSADGRVKITQRDIREVQLAKAAIRAGAILLLKYFGCEEKDISLLLLAGAFGNYINKSSALEIGLLPAIDAKRIISAGNAAGVGAVKALASLDDRYRARRLAQKVEYIELSLNADFQREFVASMLF